MKYQNSVIKSPAQLISLRLEAKMPYNFDRNPKSKKEQPKATENITAKLQTEFGFGATDLEHFC